MEFAKIVTASNGQQVLYFVEPQGGTYKLHQIFNFDEGQADLVAGFEGEDEDENERLAYAALEKVDQAFADRAIATIDGLFAEAKQ